MGLVTQILTFPLAPLRGSAWVINQVLTAAEREYYDPEPIRRQLAELERALLDGRVTEEEFDSREDALLDELEQRTAYQQWLRSGG